jgi:iron-sulfur cluster repair protein YtfE (RIC family)
MAVPLDVIRAFHNAFRKDIKGMDDAARDVVYKKGDLDLVARRYKLFNEVLIWHALGEEDFVFPVMESVAPMVAEAYERDHRGLDELGEMQEHAINSADPLAVWRVTSNFHYFLDFHLMKEEAHLYRIFNERVALPDQAAAISKIAPRPPSRSPEVVAWLYPLIGLDDRENMTRIFRSALPEATFRELLHVIQQAIGEGWADLTSRIPDLE